MDLMREKRRLMGAHRLQCSDAPDMSGANQASLEMAQLGREQLDWYKQLYQDTEPARAAAAAKAMEAADLQLSQMRFQDQLTRDQASDWKEKYKPVEDRLVKEAMEYDTATRREQEAGQAVADVTSQQQIAQRDAMNELAARGVNAGGGTAAIALSRAAQLGGAGRAAAANAARKQVETVGNARLMDAAAMGRGVISSQGTTAGLALNAGTQGAGNARGSADAATSGAGLMATGYGGAQQGLNNMANTQIGIANASAQDNSGIWGAIGKVGGAAMANPAIFSDENMKENVEPVDGEVALSAVRAIPVKEWEYKDGSPGADGGQRHVGPMAQDVQATMGDAVAPGGQQIDLISMNGQLTAAVQALDEKVNDLQITLASVVTGKKGKKKEAIYG